MAVTEGAGSIVAPIRRIDLLYDHAKSEESARALVFALNPDWEILGDVEFVRLKEGITNTLFKAINRLPHCTEDELDSDALLLRAYGNGTAVLIDREREALSHALLWKYNLAPPLLARFNNGLMYRFIKGTACTPADLRRPEVWRATAQHLGRWHATIPIKEINEDTVAVGVLERRSVAFLMYKLFEYPRGRDNHCKNAYGTLTLGSDYGIISHLVPSKPVPNVWTVMQKWISALPDASKTDKDRNILLQHELELSMKLLGNVNGLSNGEYVLGHCDLLSGNVVIHPGSHKPNKEDKVEVSFIDYEYATPAPAAFDLANHFAEWGGFECDYDVLPTKCQRREFLRAYVKSYRSQSCASSNTTNGNKHSYSSAEDADVEQLMKEVDDFRGIPGFYWGIWALIQATISQIDFDYASYAQIRLGEYWAWKAEVDGSRKNAKAEIPLRERRLALD